MRHPAAIPLLVLALLTAGLIFLSGTAQAQPPDRRAPLAGAAAVPAVPLQGTATPTPIPPCGPRWVHISSPSPGFARQTCGPWAARSTAWGAKSR
jgi:hypothetical protein